MVSWRMPTPSWGWVLTDEGIGLGRVKSGKDRIGWDRMEFVSDIVIGTQSAMPCAFPANTSCRAPVLPFVPTPPSQLPPFPFPTPSPQSFPLPPLAVPPCSHQAVPLGHACGKRGGAGEGGGEGPGGGGRPASGDYAVGTGVQAKHGFSTPASFRFFLSAPCLPPTSLSAQCPHPFHSLRPLLPPAFLPLLAPPPTPPQHPCALPPHPSGLLPPFSHCLPLFHVTTPPHIPPSFPRSPSPLPPNPPGVPRPGLHGRQGLRPGDKLQLHGYQVRGGRGIESKRDRGG